MPPKTVSILGCGWLGLPLARHLVSSGLSVSGSTTSQEKISLLQKSPIKPFLIVLKDHLIGDQNFFNSKILFLNLPFKRDFEDPREYRRQIEKVIACVEKSPIEFVIFASSTSIYSEFCQEATEDSDIDRNNLRSQALWETEQLLLTQKHFSSTIIRFAGLYGPEREVGQFLKNAAASVDGAKPMNLIHLDDAVGISAEIIHQNIRGEIVNACSDVHPMRRDLYGRIAVKEGRKPPAFIHAPRSDYKIVSNAKLKKLLHYKFLHPNPLQDY